MLSVRRVDQTFGRHCLSNCFIQPVEDCTGTNSRLAAVGNRVIWCLQQLEKAFELLGYDVGMLDRSTMKGSASDF